MKILHVYKSYYPETTGGIEQCIHALCLGLKRLGIDSAVAVCAKDLQSTKIFPYPVYRFKTTAEFASCPMSWDFLKNFKNLAADYDLIHYHFPWPFGDILQLFSGSQKPYIVTYQSDIVRQKWLNLLYQPFMHRFLKGASAIVATSQAYIETSSVLKKYRDKVKLIPIGLERSLYPAVNEERVHHWRKQLGQDFILFVGVLRYYKGLDYLLQAAPFIQEQIAIAGKGPEEAHLKALAEELKLKNVHFIGFVNEEDKVALLSLCKTVVAPAHLRSEAFCISLLEGLMFNKPLVSTELGTGTSFVNTHNISGLVVPPRDAAALATALNRLLQDRDSYQKLMIGTQQHYQQYFTLDKMAADYLDCYRRTDS